MDDRELRCEALLAAYRDGDAVDDLAQERIARRLAHNLDSEPAWLRGAAVGRVGAARRSDRGWWIGGGIAVAAALLLAFGLGRRSLTRDDPALGNAAERSARGGAGAEGREYGVVEPEQPRSRTSPEGTRETPAAAAEVVAIDEVEPAPSQAPPATSESSGHPQTTAESDSTDAPPRSRRRGQSPGEHRPAAPHRTDDEAPQPEPSAPVGSALVEEVRRLEAADAALRGGRPAAAWTELEALRKLEGARALSKEADALRVLARCAMGRADAGTHARRFLDASPNAATRRRIERACAEVLQ